MAASKSNPSGAKATFVRALQVFVVLAVAFAMVAILFQVRSPDHHGKEALEGGFPMVGVWLGDWPSDENGLIGRFEERTGVEPDLVDVFLDWQTPYENVSFTVRHIHDTGALPILTWEARDYTHSQIIEGSATTSLRDGRTLSINAYLAEFAAGACDSARATDNPILIRTLHEMNGHWYPWGIAYRADGQTVNSDESFKRAWVKVHNEFDSRCGNRIQFIYAFNHFSGGDSTFMGGYPGDAYVDFLGIDGYNWGSRAEWGWQDFDTLFKQPYCASTAVSSRPVIITETASSESGGEKGAWIRSAYQAMTDGSYPQIRGIVYFDESKQEVEIGGEMDWAVDTSQGSLQAFAGETNRLHDLREDADDWVPPAGDDVC